MIKTLIIYESRYGFTEKIAKQISLVMGPAKFCRTSEFKDKYIKDFQVVVICTPIYLEAVDSSILQFVTKNYHWITKKKVMLICTCLLENAEDRYLKPLKELLGGSVVLSASFGGELIINNLSTPDYKLIKQFYSNMGFEVKDYKVFHEDKFTQLLFDMKEIKDKGNTPIEGKLLINYIDEFIKNHNTCTLATGSENRVRATPIEYVYINRSLYIISEGGEKFLNLLLNPKVSVCIYDSYKSMSELGGMQITGTAELIDIGTKEYHSVLKEKGLSYDKLINLDVSLNFIKINIKKVEFLWSGFSKLGYDAKQIYNAYIIKDLR